MSKAFFTFFFLLLYIQSAYAIAVPPAAIDQNMVSPACVIAKPSYILGQKQVYGTDGKGPAVRIENGCTEALTIDSFLAEYPEGHMTLISQIDVQLVLGEVKHDYLFIPTPLGTVCDSIRAEREKELAEHTRKVMQRKEAVAKSASAEELLQQWSMYKIPKLPMREILCRAISVPAGASLTFAMSWGAKYEVSGPTLSAKGQMINPLDVNSPETFQFAQNGDKATRYMLAVHNIGTGQNLKLALRWLKEAAEQGYRPAILQLSECYETGKCGVEKDAKEALFWHVLGRGDIEPDDELYKRLEDWKKTHPEVTDY